MTVFFPGPINFDTIEGILRARRYIDAAVSSLGPEAVTKAAIRRRSLNDLEIVDDFWKQKDAVYRHLINSPQGVMADWICQDFMLNKISELSPDDYYTTEDHIFKKLVGLREILRSKTFDAEAKIRLKGSLAYKARRFVIIPSTDFFLREDRSRYIQFKEARYLNPAEQVTVRSVEVKHIGAVIRDLFEVGDELGDQQGQTV